MTTVYEWAKETVTERVAMGADEPGHDLTREDVQHWCTLHGVESVDARTVELLQRAVAAAATELGR